MISPLAYIHPDARLGKDVTVEPFAYITGDVIIGDGCWIGPHASVLDGARLGAHCSVHSGAVVSGVPQDLKFIGEKTTAVIGDHTTIRECATINRGTNAKGVTTVGSHCLIMAYAHVGHDCIVGDHCILVNAVSLGGEVELGDWAIMGGHSAAHQFCKVGAHAMVAGGCVLTKDIPPFTKVAHTPLSFVSVNTLGLRRRGFTNEEIIEIQDMCRILFQNGLSYTNGCNLVEQEFVNSVNPANRDLLINFIRESKRGVIRQYQSKRKDEDCE